MIVPCSRLKDKILTRSQQDNLNSLLVSTPSSWSLLCLLLILLLRNFVVGLICNLLAYLSFIRSQEVRRTSVDFLCGPQSREIINPQIPRWRRQRSLFIITFNKILWRSFWARQESPLPLIVLWWRLPLYQLAFLLSGLSNKLSFIGVIGNKFITLRVPWLATRPTAQPRTDTQTCCEFRLLPWKKGTNGIVETECFWWWCGAACSTLCWLL